MDMKFYKCVERVDMFCTVTSALHFVLLLDEAQVALLLLWSPCLYTNHMVCVAWNGMRSQYFLATNGVKQGGVLSPMLYLLYIDGLLVKLSMAYYWR